MTKEEFYSLPGEKKEVLVKFYNLNHKIIEGTYRFSKEFSIEDGNDFTIYEILKVTKE